MRSGDEYLQGRPEVAPRVCPGEINFIETEERAQSKQVARSRAGKGAGSHKKISWADLVEEGNPEIQNLDAAERAASIDSTKLTNYRC